MNEAKKKPLLLLAIDIETTNLQEDTKTIFAIGLCGLAQDQDDPEMWNYVVEECYKLLPHGLTQEEWLAEHPKYFEPNCWGNPDNAEVLSKLINGAEDPDIVMKKFAEKIDELDEEYDVMLLSDNPSFDISEINNYYRQFLKRKPINYTKSGVYRMPVDTDSYIRGKLTVDIHEKWISTESAFEKLGFTTSPFPKPDHSPENDARYIVQSYLTISQFKPEMLRGPLLS